MVILESLRKRVCDLHHTVEAFHSVEDEAAASVLE
jgi:hypothetical protein